MTEQPNYRGPKVKTYMTVDSAVGLGYMLGIGALYVTV